MTDRLGILGLLMGVALEARWALERWIGWMKGSQEEGDRGCHIYPKEKRDASTENGN